MKVEKLTEDQAVKTLDFPIEIKVYEGGTQLVPSSATITVKDPDGEEQVEDVAMSIDENGTMTYTLDSAYTADLWENAVIEVSYVVSSVTYKAVFLFDVVLNKLKPSVIDDDLKNYFPHLANQIWSGESNYDEQIQEAFCRVKRDIKNKGKRPAMLIDGMQVRELVILKTFEIIFYSFAKSDEDIWWARYQDMKEQYKTQFDALQIKYDEDESGTIDSDEDETLGQIILDR